MPKLPRPPSAAKKAHAAKIARALAQGYPDARCSLDYANALQLLIATILSAQCTDARVNKVTPALFTRYSDAKAFGEANPRELEHLVQSTGFFRNKAQSIREACRDIAEHHGGEVPRTLEELTALRGVGRKTANVVLGNAFGVPGMVVDTHVGRISRRLGLTRQNDPEKVERDLMALLPPEEWVALGHRMIHHGRRHCRAPNPRCRGCPLFEICPFKKKIDEAP
jgi:endonuclease-3